METFLSTPLTWLILAVNVGVSLWAFQNRVVMDRGTLWVGAIRQRGQWDRTLVSGFLHVATWHLALNMLTLWSIGRALESFFGPVSFGLLYFGSLLAGSFWAVTENWRRADYRAVGASGAISGLLTSLSVLAPDQTLYFFGVLPMPAALFAIAFILLSVALSGREGNVIGHEAHLGGALAGVGITLLLVPGSGARFVDAIAKMLGLG
jgi:membrane associated rhomboid family serine protease